MTLASHTGLSQLVGEKSGYEKNRKYTISCIYLQIPFLYIDLLWTRWYSICARPFGEKNKYYRRKDPKTEFHATEVFLCTGSKKEMEK